MKNIEEKVEYYFNKIKKIYITSYFRRAGWLRNNGEKAKNNVRELIENGYEYLLTDSFLDYLSFDEIYRDELMDLKNNPYQLLITLRNYFHRLFDGLSPYRRDICIDTTVLSLDKELKKDVTYESERVHELGSYKGANGYGYGELCHISNLVFAYYVINKRQDNVHELCDIFLKDIYATYDKLFLNDVNGITIDFYHRNTDERFILFVSNALKNQEENKGEGNKVIL